MTRKLSFLGYWLPLIVFCAMIFIVSSISGDELAKSPFQPSDKLAHLCEYGLLGVLFARAWFNTRMIAASLYGLGASVVYALLFGVSDELHQLFVPGRSCSAWDLCADIIGGALGALLYLWWWKRKKA